MNVLVATIGEIQLRQPIGDAAALGWRWWRRSMIDLGFCDERCITLGYVDLQHLGIAGEWILVAMERDRLLDLVGQFSLFPIVDDAEALAGVDEFAASVIARYVQQPVLL